VVWCVDIAVSMAISMAISMAVSVNIQYTCELASWALYQCSCPYIIQIRWSGKAQVGKKGRPFVHRWSVVGDGVVRRSSVRSTLLLQTTLLLPHTDSISWLPRHIEHHHPARRGGAQPLQFCGE